MFNVRIFRVRQESNDDAASELGNASPASTLALRPLSYDLPASLISAAMIFLIFRGPNRTIK